MGKDEDDRCTVIFFFSLFFVFVCFSNQRPLIPMSVWRKKKENSAHLSHKQSPRSHSVFLWLHACFYSRGDLQVYLIWSLTRLKEMLISGDRPFFPLFFFLPPPERCM